MQNSNIHFASKSTAEARWLKIGLIVAICLLALGLVAPIITLKKFVMVKSTFSVLGGAIALLQEGKLFLFAIISAFSIILPLLKMGVLAKILYTPAQSSKLEKYLHWMHLYGKWSMLDVFVVAVLVVVVKLGVIASVEMRYGLYAFAAAVILTMFITARVVKLVEQKQSAQTAEQGEITEQ